MHVEENTNKHVGIITHITNRTQILTHNLVI